ncbi:hypothetical protein ACWIWK_05995 [Helicobacter sp. 23-1048]
MAEFGKANLELSFKNRPHLVILGAGASVATIPNGDKNGKEISTMNGFIEKIGLSDLLKDIKLKTRSNNLEDIYCELYENKQYNDIRIKLEEAIRKEFGSFQIIDEPTIYDFLLLSLRKKDLIATFNWDPLLLQAYQRVVKITNNLPELAFLHGNVSIGSCDNHKVVGVLSEQCPKCGKYFTPSILLYPIKQKDYTTNLYINDFWKKFRNIMKQAYQITVFGYSAPITDIEAKKIMKESWGNNKTLEEFEFIDIDKEENVICKWKDFIYSHHYQYCNDFFESTLAKFPRRTTESLFDTTMNCYFIDNSKNEFKKDMSFKELQIVIDRLILEEQNVKNGYITMPHKNM